MIYIGLQLRERTTRRDWTVIVGQFGCVPQTQLQTDLSSGVIRYLDSLLFQLADSISILENISSPSAFRIR
jgi:hypothetical protein